MFFCTGERECLLDGSRAGNLSFVSAHQKLIFFFFVSRLSKTPKTDDRGFNAAFGTKVVIETAKTGDDNGAENGGAGEGGASGAWGQRSSAGRGGEGPERSVILLIIIIITVIVHVSLPLLSFGRSRVLV